jgi:hypothetical protein
MSDTSTTSFGALSIDHEVLTDDGWKFIKNLTDEDHLLTLDASDTLIYSVPLTVRIFDYNGPMINIQNGRLNVFGTLHLALKDTSNNTLVRLEDIIETTGHYTFKTTHKAMSADVPSLTPDCNFQTYDIKTADQYSLPYIYQGKHVVINIDTYLNKKIYNIKCYDDDVPYTTVENNSEFIYVERYFGQVAYIGMRGPIYTRRHGKCAWVFLDV